MLKQAQVQVIPGECPKRVSEDMSVRVSVPLSDILDFPAEAPEIVEKEGKSPLLWPVQNLWATGSTYRIEWTLCH